MEVIQSHIDPRIARRVKIRRNKKLKKNMVLKKIIPTLLDYHRCVREFYEATGSVKIVFLR